MDLEFKGSSGVNYFGVLECSNRIYSNSELYDSRSFRLLGNEAGDRLPLSTFFEDPFPIEKNSKPFEEVERFIWLQKIFWILRPAGVEPSMFKEVGFKNHHASFLQPSFHLRDDVPVEKVKVRDKVVFSPLDLIGVEISKNGMNSYLSLSG